MTQETLSDIEPPKPVQRWSASDYAKNGRFEQELAGQVFSMLAPKPLERILDLGCGDGTLTAEIKVAGAEVLGVDLSDELLAVARMKGLRVRKLDGHALDFVAELGGHGNVAALATAMRAVNARRNGNPALLTPWYFPTAEEYGEILAEGGFSIREIMLVSRPTPLKHGIEGWLRTFGRSCFDQFPEPERTEAVAEAAELVRPSLCDSRGVWTADHVR